MILTPDEMAKDMLRMLWEAVEAKLREKNT